MKDIKHKWTGRRFALLATAIALAVGAVGPIEAGANAGSTHQNGIVCENGTLSGSTRTFNLTAKDGYVQLPDGNTAYMWSYANGNGAFQLPGPVLCANSGETVAVVLHNNLKYDDVSIVFPGQNGVLADGAASQPVMSGSTVVSLAPSAPLNGGTITYSFVADHPGTFLYESGTNPEIQVRMGLYGALLVRPAGHPDWVYDDATTAFNTNSEYMGLLSEIDPYLNQREELRKTRRDAGRAAPAQFNLANYHPRYWLINGRGFPDSIADNGADWLPAQPYGSLAEIQPYDATTNPLPSLTRYLGVGTEDYPFHPHGANGRIVGRDGHQLLGADGVTDVSFEKFSVPIGPGQTWDSLFSYKNEEQYSPSAAEGSSNYLPTTDPQIANLEVGIFYGGSPYLGIQGDLPIGASTLNECGEFYIISHNHALYQITSWGVNMTGPITYTRVNPPGNVCP